MGESAVREKYIFFGDGGPEFWRKKVDTPGGEISCGELVNNFFISQTNIARTGDSPNVNTYLDCQPDILYFFELDFKYDHTDGRLTTEFYLKDSYKLNMEASPSPW